MKEVMHRQAADNTYLHKDFHGAMSTGLLYLETKFGAEAVREYLRQFVTAFYAPLIADIKKRGLLPLKEHFEHVYALEEGKVTITLSDDEMIMQVEACPAVMHMRQRGHHISPLFYETTKTVNEAICDGTPFAAELVSYDDATGRSTVRFYRRQP